MQTASKKVVNGWAMYDWASSSYNLVITSTIFPAYFEAIAVDDKNVSKTAVTFLFFFNKFPRAIPSATPSCGPRWEIIPIILYSCVPK